MPRSILRRASPIFGLVLALAPALGARTAHAQSVLLPLEGDAALIPAHGEELRAAIREELAAHGERVTGAEETLSGEALGAVNRCNECIARLLDERGAERAIIVSLWADDGAPAFVAVTLLDADAQTAEAEVSLEGRTLRQAVGEALAEALAAWPTRGGVIVRFVGAPAGAAVLVDRYPFGTLPARGRLSVGSHVVTAVHEGEVVARRTIEVPASETPLAFDLGGEAEPRAAARAPGEGRGWVAGPVLVGLGAGALLVEPVRGLTQRGCAETARGFCVAEDRLDRGRLAAYAASSAALAATAVVWGLVGRRKHREARSRVEVGALGATIHF